MRSRCFPHGTHGVLTQRLYARLPGWNRPAHMRNGSSGSPTLNGDVSVSVWLTKQTSDETCANGGSTAEQARAHANRRNADPEAQLGLVDTGASLPVAIDWDLWYSGCYKTVRMVCRDVYTRLRPSPFVVLLFIRHVRDSALLCSDGKAHAP